MWRSRVAGRAWVLVACTFLVGGVVSTGVQPSPARAASDTNFGSETMLSSHANDSHAPQVASAGDNVYTVWQDTGFPDQPNLVRIQFRRSTHRDATNTPVFDAAVVLASAVATPGGGVVGRPHVAADGANVFVIWTRVDLVGGGKTDIFLTRSTDSGLNFAPPVNVSGSGTVGWGSYVAVSGSDVYVVFVDTSDGPCAVPTFCSRDVFAVSSVDAGVHFGRPVNLSRSRALSPEIPNLGLALSEHNFYVVWSEVSRAATGTFGSEIRLARMSDLGQVTVPVNLSETPGVESMQPTIAASGDAVYVAWAEPQGVGSRVEQKDVYLRVSRDGGSTFNTARNLTGNPGDSAFPRLAAAGDNVFLTWMDGSSGRFDIWFTRSTTSGDAFEALTNLSAVYNARMGSWGVLPTIAAAGIMVHILWTTGANILYLGSSNAGADLIQDESGWGFLPTTVYFGRGGEIAGGQQLSASAANVYAAWEDGVVTPHYDTSKPELSYRGVDFRGGVGPMPDFEMAKVDVVQASYDATVLAAGKQTKVRVSVDNTLGDFANVDIRLRWWDGDSGPQEVVKSVELRRGTNVFFLPPTAAIRPEGSQLRVEATVDPGDSYPERDEQNNTKEVTLPVKHTGNFRVMYVPVQVNTDAYTGCRDMGRFGTSNSSFLKATFPIDDTRFQDLITCAPLTYLMAGSQLAAWDIDVLETNLEEMKWFSTLGGGSVDRVVGVVPADWFKNRTSRYGNALGLSIMGGSPSGVLVSATQLYGSTTAHEIGHTFGWVTEDNPMAVPPDPGETWSAHFDRLPARGYWVAADAPRDDAFDFMNYYSMLPARTWISGLTYEYLLGKLKDDPADPPVIGLSGLIHQDGQVELRSWYRFDGVLDRELGASGEYTLVYLDQAGTTLGSTGFDVTFVPPGGGSTLLETAPFALRVPDVPGTARIEIRHGEQVLASRVISAHTPTVTVTSPNGGEIAAPGQPLTVTWTSSDEDGDALTHVVSLSRDGGQSWIPVGLEVTGHEYTFTVSDNDTSTSALVRVTASDGINTAQDRSDATFTIRKGVGSEVTLGPTVNVSDTAIYDPVGQSSHKAVSVADGQNVYTTWSDVGSLYFRRSTDGGASFGTLTELGKTRDVSEAYGSRMAAGGGRVYIAWKGYLAGESYTQSHILFRRSTNGGASFEPAQALEPLGGTSSENPQVAASGDDLFVLWYDSQTSNLILRVSHDAGATFGDPLVVGNAAPQPSVAGMNAVSPRLVADGSDVFITWSSYVDGKTDVFFARSTDAGASFAGAVKLSSNPSGAQADIEPQLAVADGRLHVAWREVVPSADASSVNHLFVQTSADDGASFSPALDLRPQWPASSPLAYGLLQSFNLAASGFDVALTWMSGPLSVVGGGDPDNGRELILLSASHDHGATFAAPVRIVADDATRLTDPPKVLASASNIYVAWSQLFPIGSTGYFSAEARLARSTDGGATFGDPMSLATSGSCDTYATLRTLPMIAAADGARVFWQARNCARTGMADKDIFLRSIHETVSTNQPPEVDAGTDLSAAAGDIVSLVGTGTDPEGDPLLVSWSQAGGPPVSLQATASSGLNFRAPEVSGPTTFTFQFTATDGLVSSTDSVVVTVAPRPPITNFETQYPEVWTRYIAPALDEGPPRLPTPVPSFTVSKACKAEPVSQAGPAVFTIAFDNTGDADLHVVPSEGAAFDVAVGQSHSYDYSTSGPFDAAVDNTVTGDVTLADGTGGTYRFAASDTCDVKGTVEIVKTVDGQPPAAGSVFTFQLRQGASTASDGTILATQTTDATGHLGFGMELNPGADYQVCEWVFPGWNTNLAGDGPLFVPNSIIPPSLPNPNVNNLTVCADFRVTSGQKRAFTVNNASPPGGRALTIGFWKNWASCASNKGRGQQPVLDQTLAAARVIGDNTDGHGTLPGIALSATSGSYWQFGPAYYLLVHGNPTTPESAPDCLKAVRLLDKSRPDNGKKMASDPAFSLVAQLLAAELNLTAGAGTNGTVLNAVDQSVLLLGKYRFDGNTHTKISATDATTINNLSKILDDYNNNR